jgi:hypothetical protein
MLQPANRYLDWCWDNSVYTLLNAWYMPFRMPEMFSEADRWASQFTLNGIKLNTPTRVSPC